MSVVQNINCLNDIESGVSWYDLDLRHDSSNPMSVYKDYQDLTDLKNKISEDELLGDYIDTNNLVSELTSLAEILGEGQSLLGLAEDQGEDTLNNDYGMTTDDVIADIDQAYDEIVDLLNQSFYDEETQIKLCNIIM